MIDLMVVHGPGTGSSKLKISRSSHGRIILDLENDFGKVRGVFTDKNVDQIIAALKVAKEPI